MPTEAKSVCKKSGERQQRKQITLYQDLLIEFHSETLLIAGVSEASNIPSVILLVPCLSQKEKLGRGFNIIQSSKGKEYNIQNIIFFT